MTDKTMVKVGDVVAWDEVPSGAMVRLCIEVFWYGLRIEDDGCWVGSFTLSQWHKPRRGFTWIGRPRYASGDTVIIALNLTGNETADELRTLAEAFEREHPAT